MSKSQALNKLYIKMVQAGYEDFDIRRINELVTELQSCGVQGIDAFVRILLDRVGNRQEYLDITKEGRFARILCRNGFSKIHIEYSDQGPDLRANYNRQTIYFEVARRRPNKEDDKWEESEVSWVAPDSAEDILPIIERKLRQFSLGERNVVVYWSSTIRVGTPELQDVFAYIRQENVENPEHYQKLSGVLFTAEEGINISTLQQYYLFENDKAYRKLGTRLTRKLESLHTEDPKKLKRRYKSLGEWS